ncbi:hypothetical protein L829_0433 [Mycobacteroides abscessus MAB_030201_1075]|uniref:Uncharacterized protein n=1 Tax=Mycobacteroides abscessus MAB_030201_1075 TaxID=1335410 RepID=A0A829PH43_9MYCO|nr:hypothetical protein L835_2454 [Mycobacteroides abscessus MAB_110811_1470]ETZ86895.1 hypothetical protein L829_0433 [Mycobacteroides abscessus MAB_030201_1075]ETZ92994.1 hypothetical protein L828_2507 [Mycobacteroides abscessus MAB_030201_1061]
MIGSRSADTANEIRYVLHVTIVRSEQVRIRIGVVDAETDDPTGG